MKILIENMLRVKSGEIHLQPGGITTLVGDHAAGKTSLGSLVGSLSARNENPYHLAKSQKKAYLHDGADAGRIELRADDDEPICRWDAVSGELDIFVNEEERDEIPSTPAAVGLINFCDDLTPKMRTALWEGYFLPPLEILKEKLEARLKEHLDKKTLKDVIDVIDDGEMKNVIRAYEIRRKNSKSMWTQVTGEHWGVAKAADWIPDGWSAGMDGMDETDAQTALDECKNDLRTLQVMQSVTASDIAKAIEAQAELSVVNEQGLALTEKAEEVEKKLVENHAPMVKAKKALNNTVSAIMKHGQDKPLEPVETFKCEACGASLMPTPDENGVFNHFNEEENTKLVNAWAKKQKTLTARKSRQQKAFDKLQQEREQLEEEKRSLNGQITQLRGRGMALLEMAEKADAEVQEVDQEEIERAEIAVAEAVKSLELVKKRFDARKQYLDVLAYDAIIKELGPKGVRSTMVKEAMESFTAVINRAVAITGWPKIELDSSYAISIGGRTILRVCAQSERIRTQYILQIAVALSQGEPLVILDNLNELRHDYQAQLVEMVQMICNRPDSPAFLLCGAEDMFQPENLTEDFADDFYSMYRIDEGVITEFQAD